MNRCLSLCGIFSGNTIRTFVTYSGWSSSKSLQRLCCPMLAYGLKHSKASSWSGLPRLVRTDDLPSIMAVAISASGKRESLDIGLMCDRAWCWLRSMTDFRMDLELPASLGWVFPDVAYVWGKWVFSVGSTNDSTVFTLGQNSVAALSVFWMALERSWRHLGVTS